MKIKKGLKKTAALVLIRTTACLTLLAGCSQPGTGAETSPENFRTACEDDNLTVTMDADPSELGLEGVKTYCKGEHSTENILTQYISFSDDKAAADAFETFKKSIDPGAEGSMYVITEKTYTAAVATRDSRYTKAIQAGNLIISVAGPSMYKSALNRILLKFGYNS